MAMEPLPATRKRPVKGKGGKFARGKREGGSEGGFKKDAKYAPRLLGKAYFQRRRGCPFSGPKAPKIDYKDTRMLSKYMSDLGKILPRHLSGVCAAKQRELATAIARARMLALIPFVVQADPTAEREQRNERIAARAARFAERDAQRARATESSEQ